MRVPLRASSGDDDPRIQQLEEQVQRMRIDVESAQADVIAKNREIAGLKAQITKQRQPLAADVEEVLEFWKAVLNHPRAKTPADGERAKVVRRQLKHHTVKELKQAVIGCGRSEWHVRNGKTDIELICRNEVKVKEFRQLALQPFGTGQVRSPDSFRRVFDRGSADPCGEFLMAVGRAGFDVENLAVGSWKAQCPAHQGTDRNLAVREGDNGDCLVKCFSHGCSVSEICDAVGLPVAALFRGEGSSASVRRRARGVEDRAVGQGVVGFVRADGQLGLAA